MSEDLEKRVNHLEYTVTRLEKVEERRGEEIDRLILTVDRLVGKLDALMRRFDKNELEMETIRKDVWNSKLITKATIWLAGVVVGGAVLTIIAFLFGGANG